MATDYVLREEFPVGDKFSGRDSENAKEFLTRFRTAALMNSWDDCFKRYNFEISLIGPARMWLDNLSPKFTSCCSFDEIELEFQRAFSYDVRRDIGKQLYTREMQMNEGLNEYLWSIIELCNKYNINMSDEEKVNHFMEGLRQPYRDLFQAVRPRELDHIIGIVQSYESHTRSLSE